MDEVFLSLSIASCQSFTIGMNHPAILVPESVAKVFSVERFFYRMF